MHLLLSNKTQEQNLLKYWETESVDDELPPISFKENLSDNHFVR